MTSTAVPDAVPADTQLDRTRMRRISTASVIGTTVTRRYADDH
ncbi:hypothetical protein [Brevibacterium gallinarum]|nr:hypothetical protein [Brevibacterium gallinarum]